MNTESITSITGLRPLQCISCKDDERILFKSTRHKPTTDKTTKQEFECTGVPAGIKGEKRTEIWGKVIKRCLTL